jgi:hypothetical protein
MGDLCPLMYSFIYSNMSSFIYFILWLIIVFVIGLIYFVAQTFPALANWRCFSRYQWSFDILPCSRHFIYLPILSPSLHLALEHTKHISYISCTSSIIYHSSKKVS